MTIRNIVLVYLLLLWSTTIFGQSTPPPTSNACIGPEGQLLWQYWNNVEGITMDNLYTHHSFPQGPTGSQYLQTPDSPLSFNEYMGSMMKGYFTVPQSGKYAFNVMADDRAHFFLSTDDDPANQVLEVATTGATGYTSYYNRPESHSDTLDLLANTYYYFELHHKERTGSDYVRLFWNTPAMADSAWQIVPVNHVYEKLCETLCPAFGTPCDDGNASTTNDREDGACNCIGDQPSALACVGEQGLIRELVWTDVPGSGIDNLYADPSYPALPDTVGFDGGFNQLSKNNDFAIDTYGSVVKAYITVPVSGDYQFNMTADDRGKLFLSADEEPFNMVEICNTVGGNTAFQFDEYPEQTSPVQSLIAGQYYYLELHYKENTNTARYYVFWKTPFYPDTNLRVVPTTYLYEYGCELACLPDGTPCNDEDPSTYMDIVTACNCAGTPCPNGDCTELLTYTPYDECAYTGAHVSGDGNSWLSCTTSPSPNPLRGDSHWIHYDFDQPYILNSSMFYNYNVSGGTGSGYKDFVIDYSIDGVNWTELGVYQLPQASGTNTYAGVVGPSLNGIAAKHVLITALTVWDNGACAGFSEVVFEGETCPDTGTTCDDGDPLTLNDQYDAACTCRGFGNPINACVVDSLTMIDDPAQSITYSAIKYLESNLLVDESAFTSFVAGEEILMKPGFEVELGANFLAVIQVCSGASLGGENVQALGLESNLLETEEDFLFVHHDLIQQKAYVQYRDKQVQKAQLDIMNHLGEVILSEALTAQAAGIEYRVDLTTYSKGVHTIALKIDGIYYSKRIVID